MHMAVFRLSPNFCDQATGDHRFGFDYPPSVASALMDGRCVVSQLTSCTGSRTASSCLSSVIFSCIFICDLTPITDDILIGVSFHVHM